LPYFREGQEQPASCAGTVSSNEDGSHQLFYWMFPAENDDAPVALWLNGGPGASSSFANFLMNGPMRMERTGSGVDDFEVYLNPFGSWSYEAHMIYVDQPVGTGFSYGTPLLTTMDEAANEFINFMDSLYELYPQFKGRDLYITGESYAGKYVPRYSWALFEDDQQTEEGVKKFNLKSSLIGDPYTVPMTQRTSMHIVPEALNILDDSNMPQIAAMERRCKEMVSTNLTESADTCSDIMGYICDVSGDVFPYDQRIFAEDWDPIEQVVTDYFQISGKVEQAWEAVHIMDSTKEPKFEMSSGRVGDAFVDDNLLSYNKYVNLLVQNESPVLIYAGEFDA